MQQLGLKLDINTYRTKFSPEMFNKFRKSHLKTILSQKNSNIDEKFKISLNAFEVFSIFALGEVYSFSIMQI